MVDETLTELVWQWEKMDHERKIEPVYEPLMDEFPALRHYVDTRSHATRGKDNLVRDISIVRKASQFYANIKDAPFSHFPGKVGEILAGARQVLLENIPQFHEFSKERAQFYISLNYEFEHNVHERRTGVIITPQVEAQLYRGVFGEEDTYDATLSFYEDRAQNDLVLARITDSLMLFNQVVHARGNGSYVGNLLQLPRADAFEAVAEKSNEFYVEYLSKVLKAS